MLLPQPMAHGRLVSRYKRFFADVVMDDGTALTAHCPNPGAMLGLNTPGLGVWLSKSDVPKRKLAWTLELVEDGGGLAGVNTLHQRLSTSQSPLVGVNTMRANGLAAEALANGGIAELSGYTSVRREVRYGAASRVDFLLEAAERRPCWLEVKSVTLHRGGGLAEFPDCASARGGRHFAELAAMVVAGHRAAVLFVVQRGDCDRFALANDLDPTLAEAVIRAETRGVEVLAYECDITPDRLSVAGRIAYERADGRPS